MFLNAERRFALLHVPHLVVTFRAHEFANGPGDQTTDIFLSDAKDTVIGRPKTVKHLIISGEVASEADTALVHLVNEVTARCRAFGAMDVVEEGEELFHALRQELFDFVGLVVLGWDKENRELVEVLTNYDTRDQVMASRLVTLPDGRKIVHDGDKVAIVEWSDQEGSFVYVKQ